MRSGQLITPWGTMLDGDNVAQIALDYPVIQRDATGQAEAAIPPDPNLCVVDFWADDGVFAEIEADPDYLVLWDEPNPRPPNGIPPASEFGQHVAYFARNGVNPSDFARQFGGGVNGRTRHQLANEYTAWLHDRPRKKGK